MRIAVIGVGLIGGSVALAARERLGATVVGYDPDPAALAAALSRAVLDSGAGSVGEAVTGAEAVFVAAPVGVLPALVADVLAAAPRDCVVSDVGSTKQQLTALEADERFVGGHPLAGAETAVSPTPGPICSTGRRGTSRRRSTPRASSMSGCTGSSPGSVPARWPLRPTLTTR